MRRIAFSSVAVMLLLGGWIWSRPPATSAPEATPSASLNLPRVDDPIRPLDRRHEPPPAATIGAPWAEGQGPKDSAPSPDSRPLKRNVPAMDPTSARRDRVKAIIESLGAKAETAERDGNSELAATYRKRVQSLRSELEEAAETP